MRVLCKKKKKKDKCRKKYIHLSKQMFSKYRVLCFGFVRFTAGRGNVPPKTAQCSFKKKGGADGAEQEKLQLC